MLRFARRQSAWWSNGGLPALSRCRIRDQSWGPCRIVAGRRAKRFRANQKIPVGFLGSGFRFSGDLLDLSTTGALIRSSETPEVGAVGRLAIAVGYETSRAVAIVRRVIPGLGIALEFSHMGPRDRELLRRLMLRLDAPPRG